MAQLTITYSRRKALASLLFYWALLILPFYGMCQTWSVGAQLGPFWQVESGSVQADSILLQLYPGGTNKMSGGLFVEYDPIKNLGLRLSLTNTANNLNGYFLNNKEVCPPGTFCPLSYEAYLIYSTVKLGINPIYIWPIRRRFSGYIFGNINLNVNHSHDGALKPTIPKEKQLYTFYQALPNAVPRTYSSYGLGAGMRAYGFFLQLEFNRTLGRQFYNPVPLDGNTYAFPSSAIYFYWGLGYQLTFKTKKLKEKG